MADEERDLEKGVRELEAEITCAICHNHYTDPKVLSCCHYYCKQCIHDLARRTGLNKPFSCPECRKETTLPQGSVDNLQAAFFVNRMKDVHSKLERATGKVEVMCEICSEDKAEAFCRQCAKFICDECAKSHQRMKMLFSGHKIVTLTELQEGGTKEIVIQEPTPELCKLHKDPIKVYCFDCSSLICRDCTIKDHLGHNYEFITVAGPEKKEELIQQLKPLRVVKDNLFGTVEGVKANKSEVETQGQAAANYINDSFNELCQIIESRRKEVLKQSAAMVSRKLKNLSSREETLCAAATIAESVIEYTEQCVEHSTDADILQKHAEIQARIKQEIAQHGKKKLNPVKEVNLAVEVRCIQELKDLCAKMTLLPIKCAVTVREAEVGKVCEAIVKITTEMPTSTACVINCELKQLASGATTKCEVNLVKNNEYCVQYTPTIRGRHELLVSLNGQEVAGSPFPVFVAVDPSKLGNSIRVIATDVYPRDIAINSKEEVIVLTAKGLLVFNKDSGRLLQRSYTLSHLENPRSIVLDSEDDSIYITDRNSKHSKTFKLSSNLVMQGVSSTKTLKLTKQIDHYGHLYHCSDSEPIITVFGKNNEVLRSFGRHHMTYPYGCAVNGQCTYLYVADRGSCCITVFTTKGKFVTSFGMEGGEIGSFNFPCGLCFDRDGFLYVCDYNNKRVQIF